MRLTSTGNSANLYYYVEPGRPRGHLWAELLRSDDTLTRPGGTARRRPIPTFSLTLIQHGVGELGRTTYTPKTRPQPGRLPDRTVTRLARELLARLAAGEHELTVTDPDSTSVLEPLRTLRCSCGWDHTDDRRQLPRRTQQRLHREHVAACRALANRLPASATEAPR